MLLGLGLCHSRHTFEFCSGPGYIGFSLLANGLGDRLTLADINSVAVKAARKTVAYNKLEEIANIYRSDAFRQIPEHEKWDLVVGNPPHFLRSERFGSDIMAIDRNRDIHRRFYLTVKQHMKPGGHVAMMENSEGSTVGDFESMTRAGGGTLVTVRGVTDGKGTLSPFYVIVSQW